MRTNSKLQEYIVDVTAKRDEINLNLKEMQENYLKKIKVIKTKKLQNWKKEIKILKQEYTITLREYNLTANKFFTEEISKIKTAINLNLDIIKNSKQLMTKDNKIMMQEQIKNLKQTNKINYQKLNILQPHLFWTIVLTFIKIAFIGFGGGNAMLPIILTEIVEKKGWISEEYFDKIIILSNALPGPATIQVPAAIGYQLYGWRGALAASLVANFPLMILVGVLTIVLQNVIPPLYLAYISLSIMPVILALIFVLIIKMFRSSTKEITLYVSLPIIIFWVIFLIAVPAPYNIPAIVMIVMLIISLIIFSYKIKRQKGKK